MEIKWGNLGAVLGVSLGITITVVVMFSLGVVAWGRAGGPRGGRSREGQPRDGSEKAALVVAALCFAACLAVAAYGIDLIIPG